MRSIVKRITLLGLCLVALSAFAGNPNPTQGKFFLTPTAPTNGTNEIQTLTFSGTITGGTFILRFNNNSTGPISWSSTNATLVASIDAALEALPTIGAGGVATAVDVMTAGIGTITVTFGGKNAKLDVSQITRTSALTGSGADVVVTTTTPGVTADARASSTGSLDVAQDTWRVYVNRGASPSPLWTPELGHKTVTLSAANINGMYAAPVLLVPAPGAGHSISVAKVIFAITRTSTAFASGGVGIIQYDSTVNGGGTNAVDSTLASTVFTGSAGLSNSMRNGAVISDSGGIDNKGIYISNQTGAFTTGTGTAVVDVWYYNN